MINCTVPCFVRSYGIMLHLRCDGFAIMSIAGQPAPHEVDRGGRLTSIGPCRRTHACYFGWAAGLGGVASRCARLIRLMGVSGPALVVSSVEVAARSCCGDGRSCDPTLRLEDRGFFTLRHPSHTILGYCTNFFFPFFDRAALFLRYRHIFLVTVTPWIRRRRLVLRVPVVCYFWSNQSTF